MSDDYDLPVEPVLRIFARCWEDDEFRERFTSSPKDVLAEYGVSVPDDVEIVASQDKSNTRHVVIPMPPKPDELNRQTVKAILDSSVVSVCRRCVCFQA